MLMHGAEIFLLEPCLSAVSKDMHMHAKVSPSSVLVPHI